jgi:hypothetical protein
VKHLQVTEIKGDVTFYEDSKRNKYYQIYGQEIYRILNGNMQYTKFEIDGLYVIKFNNNCIDGFSIWKDNQLLDKGFWELHKVKERIKELI